jgi:hypothetical protein
VRAITCCNLSAAIAFDVRRFESARRVNGGITSRVANSIHNFASHEEVRIVTFVMLFGFSTTCGTKLAGDECGLTPTNETTVGEARLASY